MTRPPLHHYDPSTGKWDDNTSPGTGIREALDGFHWVSFMMGSLQRFGPVATEEEARRRHKEEMDEEYAASRHQQTEGDGS